MEVEVSDPNPVAKIWSQISEKERVRVKRKTLQTVLEQCQQALELINASTDASDEDDSDIETTVPDEEATRPSLPPDPEADEV